MPISDEQAREYLARAYYRHGCVESAEHVRRGNVHGGHVDPPLDAIHQATTDAETRAREAALEEAARVADGLANRIQDMPRELEPTYASGEMWDNVEDAARDIADNIRALKPTTAQREGEDG